MPRRLEELLRLPGVARKTANVVAAELGDAQGIVVDTHVRRLSQRLGLTRQEDPVKIERDLVRLVPRADWARFPHLLIWHGRRVCDGARAPLRGLRAHRPLPVEPGRRGARYAGAQRDEQPAVVVVGGEEVARDVLPLAGRASSARAARSSRRTPHSSASATGLRSVVEAGEAEAPRRRRGRAGRSSR